jgi:hypothetical protein
VAQDETPEISTRPIIDRRRDRGISKSGHSAAINALRSNASHVQRNSAPTGADVAIASHTDSRVIVSRERSLPTLPISA